jgi:choice-of-anchor B domain-containing protein
VLVGFLPCPGTNCTWTPSLGGGRGGVTRHEEDGKKECPHTIDSAGRHEECFGSSQWRDMEVYGDHVYIGSEEAGHGLVVFDLRQLRNVTNPPVQFAATFRYTGVGQSHTITVNPETGGIFINGSRSATACAPNPTGTGAAVMLDASVNPSQPTFVGCSDIAEGYVHDSQCVTYHGPDAAYTGRELCFNSNGRNDGTTNYLAIVDVTDKPVTTLISKVTYAGAGYTHQGWLTEDHRYFLLDDELDETNFSHPTETYIWDMLHLASPQLIGIHIANTAAIDHNQYIVGKYTYQSNYRAGLRILHTGRVRLGNLAEVAYFDIYPSDNQPFFAGTWGNYPFFPSGNVVVNTMETGGGVFVLRPRRTNVSVAAQALAPGLFQVTVSNEGGVGVENVELHLTGTIRALRPSQGQCTTRPGRCALGAMGPGGTATVQVKVSPVSIHDTLQAEIVSYGVLDDASDDDSADLIPLSASR